MAESNWVLPLSVLLVGLTVAFAVTPLSGRKAERFGVLDHADAADDGKKRNSRWTPYIGDIAIFLVSLMHTDGLVQVSR